MSLPTGRQLLLFAALQLVALWGVALLLARGVTPEAQDPAPTDTSDIEIESETPPGLWSLVSDTRYPSVPALPDRTAAGPVHGATGPAGGIPAAGAGNVLADGTDGALSPGFWERAAGSRERQRRVKRAGRWSVRVHWLPGPTGLVPVPHFQKPCHKKREPAPPRS